MNLTDLTAELEAHAADAAPATGTNRLTGVRHRIRVRRRRQLATAAGITALCVAAVISVPGVSGLRADRRPAPVATDGPTTSDPLLFARAVAGDPLVASAVGVAGQRDLVLRFTPTDTNLAVSEFCRVPGASDRVSDDDSSGLTGTASVNGHRMMFGECSGDARPNRNTGTRGGDAGKDNRAGWASLGVLPGRESVFRMRVTARPGVAIPPDVRLGLGIYQLSAPRLTSDGVTIPQLSEADGHGYQLAGFRTARVTAKNRRLAINVPAGRFPVQVFWGLRQGEAETETETEPRGTAELRVDGGPASVSADGGITGYELLDDAAAHRVEVRITPEVRGTLVIAYYVRKD